MKCENKYFVQVVSTVSLIAWCISTEDAIYETQNRPDILAEWFDVNVKQLASLIDLINKGKCKKIRALLYKNLKT